MLSATDSARYITAGDVIVHRRATEIPLDAAFASLAPALDTRRGALFLCAPDVPGRYARSDVGFVDPPLALHAGARRFTLAALNPRGRLLLPRLGQALARIPEITALHTDDDRITGDVPPGPPGFAEEVRTRQPSTFTVVRALAAVFASPVDDRLGFYGAFGYDLAFEIDPIELRHARPAGARDLVLYLPDAIVVADHRRGRAHRYDYEFVVDWAATAELPRTGASEPFVPATAPAHRDHAPGAYAAVVERAHAHFARGDLFEVVPSQSFFEPAAAPPSEIFRRLCRRNPAPYAFHVNLGAGEHLIGASPEMFVRVTGDRVETAPIAGTIARGEDALGDAEQVARLYASAKDTAELTMCTDVDRNDKSRVCVPGSVQVLARRQIEVYSRLIHTADHVEGRLLPGFDALDAFLAHAWAVTITGAPKLAAMQFIEDHEQRPRGFYGGAVGFLGFDGRLDTGLALRMMHVRDGMAEIRAGATLLHASDPAEEERETELKASALLDALRGEPPRPIRPAAAASGAGRGRRVLLVDHRDSFVHTLGNYLRQTGAEVVTLRAGFAAPAFAAARPDLVVLSPGPGTPADFDLSRSIACALEAGAAIFGVCLGLQGLVEHFGGRLGVLPTPAHGRDSLVRVRADRLGLFAGLPREFRAGRYHSLYAAHLPPSLRVTAESEDGVPMAIEHATLPIAAVQFHPESIMTARGELGLRLLENALHATGAQGALDRRAIGA